MCSVEKSVPKSFAIFTGKHLSWRLFNKVAGLKALLKRDTTQTKRFFLLKKTPAQVFSCEYCEIFKNTCFEKQLQMAASYPQ